MTKRRNKSRRSKIGENRITAYATLGRKVYLGRTGSRVRHNAIEAGLIPVSAQAMRKAMSEMRAIQRLILQGEWYNTVKY